MHSCVEATASSGCCLHSWVKDHALLGRPQTLQEGRVGPAVREISQVDISTHHQGRVTQTQIVHPLTGKVQREHADLRG